MAINLMKKSRESGSYDCLEQGRRTVPTTRHEQARTLRGKEKGILLQDMPCDMADSLSTLLHHFHIRVIHETKVSVAMSGNNGDIL